LLTISFGNTLIAQSSENNNDFHGLRFSGIIHISRIVTNEFRPSPYSRIGIGIDMDYRFNSKFSLLTRGIFRSWKDDPRTIIHICFSPKYSFELSKKVSLSPYIGIGPSLIIGNDYGALFASSMAGVKLNYNLWQKKSLFFGGALNQAMSFHPGHFEFIEAFIGIDF